MKTYTIILASMLLLLFSCKSQKDVSRSVINQTRGESLVTTDDSIKTHRETSQNVDEVKTETTITYSKKTEFAPDNSVVSIVETWNNINLQVDFKSRLDEIKREDVKLISITQTIDTVSTQEREVVKESTDSRPVQGLEWLWIILASVGAIIVMRLIVIKLM